MRAFECFAFWSFLSLTAVEAGFQPTSEDINAPSMPSMNSQPAAGVPTEMVPTIMDFTSVPTVATVEPTPQFSPTLQPSTAGPSSCGDYCKSHADCTTECDRCSHHLSTGPICSGPVTEKDVATLVQ